jgi:hypothetical protein
MHFQTLCVSVVNPMLSALALTAIATFTCWKASSATRRKAATELEPAGLTLLWAVDMGGMGCALLIKVAHYRNGLRRSVQPIGLL